MKYEVIIRAIIYKTITVDADNEDEAYEEAHDNFQIASDEWPERYEEVMSITAARRRLFSIVPAPPFCYWS